MIDNNSKFSIEQNLPLDEPRTEFKKLSKEHPGELTIYWKDNDPPQVVKQVLKAFQTVNIDITSEFDMNLKKLKLTVRRENENENEAIIDVLNLFSRHNYVIQMQKNRRH